MLNIHKEGPEGAAFLDYLYSTYPNLQLLLLTAKILLFINVTNTWDHNHL